MPRSPEKRAQPCLFVSASTSRLRIPAMLPLANSGETRCARNAQQLRHSRSPDMQLPLAWREWWHHLDAIAEHAAEAAQPPGFRPRTAAGPLPPALADSQEIPSVRFGRNSAPTSDPLFPNRPNPGTSTAEDLLVTLAARVEAVEERCRIHGCAAPTRSEEHTSELQSRPHLVCRLLLEKKKK